MTATLLPVLPVARAMLGMPELLVILAIVVILFGATKLPQLGKGIGEALGNFKKAQRDAERDSLNHAESDSLNHAVDATPRVATQPREAHLEKDAPKA